MLISLSCSLRRRDDLLGVASESQDVKSAAGTVRTVNQAPVVNLNVVDHAGALALAGRSLGAKFTAFFRFGVRACRYRVLIRGRNEIAHLVNGKGVANIPNAHARIEPRKHRD